MLEDLNVNLGKVSSNDFKESDSITIIRELMEKNQKIKVRTSEADKIPNLDGKVMILDSNSMERITVEVQVKTLPVKYQSSNPYKYSCDTKVFNVVKHNVTFNPVVLLLVDVINKKLYWKYISKEYVQSLDIEHKESKTIQFDDNDLYEEDNFILTMIKIFKNLGIIIEKGTNPYLLIEQSNPNFNKMQKEIDRINNMFDTGLKSVKDLLFPNIWKFGLAYEEYENGSALGIYTIRRGQNDTLIRNFDIKNGKYMRLNFTFPVKEETIRNVLDNWVEEVLNAYFNIHGLHPKYLPNMVLNEIIYEFLDRLARDVKELQKDNNDIYKNDIESLSTVIQYYNGLKTYHYRLVKEIPNSNITKALMNIYKAYENKFLVFNPILQPNNEEYEILVDSIMHPRTLPCEISFVGSDINIELFELALEELKSRGVDKVKRTWVPRNKNEFQKQQKENPNLETDAYGWVLGDLYDNLNLFFNHLEDIYNETYVKHFGSDNQYKVTGEFLITYDRNNPYGYTIFYHKSDKFKLNIKNISQETAIKEYGDFSYYESSSSGDIDLIFAIPLPMYNYVRLLINLGTSLSYGLEFKYNCEINQFYSIKDLPIISDYIILCKEKKDSSS